MGLLLLAGGIDDVTRVDSISPPAVEVMLEAGPCNAQEVVHLIRDSKSALLKIRIKARLLRRQQSLTPVMPQGMPARGTALI
jgi:hypothetical protein